MRPRDAFAIFAVALVARIGWHLLREQRDWADTAIYVQTGAALLKTGLMTSYIYMPGYPALIGAAGYDGVLWVQFLLSAVSAVFVAYIAEGIWQSRTAALVSGVLAAMYPLLIFFANLRLSETLFIFLLLGSYLALYRGYFLLGSIVLVASILVRPAVDYLAPLLIVAFCLARGECRLLPVLKRLGIYAAVYVAMMSPWWLHNSKLYGQFVRLNLGDGIHLVLENNTMFEKVGLDFVALQEMFAKFPTDGSPVARNDAMKAAARDYVINSPEKWLLGSVRRFFMFWSPSPDSSSRMVNLISAATIVPIWIALCIALLGAGRGVFVRAGPILLFVVFLTALHAATHSLWRYRLPLDPFLVALAGGVVLHPRIRGWAEKWRRR